MGYRTVVVLNNDCCSEWEKDAELGRKIALGMTGAMTNPDEHEKYGREYNMVDLGYGHIVECAHADTQRLIAFDGYNGSWMPGTSYWRRGDNDADMKLRLLKEAADEMGYQLVKKSGSK